MVFGGREGRIVNGGAIEGRKRAPHLLNLLSLIFPLKNTCKAEVFPLHSAELISHQQAVATTQQGTHRPPPDIVAKIADVFSRDGALPVHRFNKEVGWPLRGIFPGPTSVL
jgi:hypothetical protein